LWACAWSLAMCRTASRGNSASFPPRLGGSSAPRRRRRSGRFFLCRHCTREESFHGSGLLRLCGGCLPFAPPYATISPLASGPFRWCGKPPTSSVSGLVGAVGQVQAGRLVLSPLGAGDDGVVSLRPPAPSPEPRGGACSGDSRGTPTVRSQPQLSLPQHMLEGGDSEYQGLQTRAAARRSGNDLHRA